MAAKVVAEDEVFLTLFEEIFLKGELSDTPEDIIAESIDNFVEYFKTNRSAAGACAADRFKARADYVGYFYWNSPISAAVSRQKALAAMQNCEEFRDCFNQPSIKIVSVGGGTGSDLVGLYSAIYRISTFQDMSVHLIDNISDWKSYFNEVLEFLAAGDFGDASHLIKNKQFSSSFICADMRKAMIPECKEALEKANFVWLKGFLSTLDNDWERYKMTEKIILQMTRGALLVVMESPAYDQFGDFVERKLIRRLYSSSDGSYMLKIFYMPKFRIIESNKQEIIIFERI